MLAGGPTLPLHNGTNFRVDQPYLYKMEYTSDWASTILSFSNGQFISAFNIVTGLVLMYTQVLSTYLHGSHLHTHRTHQIHYVIALSAQCSVKSVNLQYNTLVCGADGTNDSSTQRLMFQVLFFSDFLQTQGTQNSLFLFLKSYKKKKLKGFFKEFCKKL